MLSLYASGANQKFGRKGRWFLKSADASTACLQGKQPEDERPDKLYMLPPQDPITAQARGLEAPLFEIVGNVHGLPNAPRLWSKEVDSKLKKAGFKTRTLDDMLFLYRDPKTNDLLCMVLVYVDDFMMLYHESFQSDTLREMFRWGEWNDIEDGFRLKGKEMKAHLEAGEWVVRITQQEFIRGMATGKIPRSRTQGSPLLTPQETTEFRPVAGSLQWLSGQTRPDLAAGTSLANRGLETSIDDLKGLYKLIAYAKSTDNVGLTVRGIPMDSETVVVSYGDCSWANAQGLKSQEGIAVVLSTPKCLDGLDRCNLVDWKTTRTPRVVRSTVAGEAYAADDAIDRAHQVNAVLTEIITGTPVLRTGLQLKHVHVTDCRSLFDAVISANPNTEEKRVLMAVRAIQEAVDTKLFRTYRLNGSRRSDKGFKCAEMVLPAMVEGPYLSPQGRPAVEASARKSGSVTVAPLQTPLP